MAIARYWEVAGSCDQLSLAGLARSEYMLPCWQFVMEAHSDNPSQPDYDSAACLAGVAQEKFG
eukprot:3660871-Lingulodinium_polyedra.AAC.1